MVRRENGLSEGKRDNLSRRKVIQKRVILCKRKVERESHKLQYAKFVIRSL
jgi:hypothetical protein